jgi:hypothetical protein
MMWDMPPALEFLTRFRTTKGLREAPIPGEPVVACIYVRSDLINGRSVNGYALTKAEELRRAAEGK